MNVGAFGSCRVWTPLRLAQHAGRLTFRREKTYGFLHNSAETIQAIRVLSGHVQVDPQLLRLLSIVGNIEGLGKTDLFRQQYADVDAFVVEISSMRLIEYGGLILQIQQFSKRFRTAGQPPVAKVAYQRVSHWPRRVEDLLASGGLAPGDVAMLQQTRLREQSTAELMEDLAWIRARLNRPILFVGHFVLDHKGVPIPLRRKIREALVAFTSQHPDTRFFDPTEPVEAAGHPAALIDLGHYTPAFERTMADRLASELATLQSAVSPEPLLQAAVG